MDESEKIVPPPKRIRYEAVIAVGATIVSICALGITLYQTYIMKQQQHAAVWPKLYVTNSWAVEVDQPFYRLHIRNVGIGPAIIRKVHIQYKDKAFADFAQLAPILQASINCPIALVLCIPIMRIYLLIW